MNIQLIIDEADTRIPNAFSTAQKVDWLNEVNFEFFDIVKIPKAYSSTANGSTSTFTLPTDAREKNIRKVVVGSNYYRSMAYEDITAAFNYFTLDDATQIMTTTPAPPSGPIVVVYDRVSGTSFTSGNLTVSPDAPTEYHWIYVLGLCTRIAKAMNDVVLANNYDADYKNNLSVAQQNYVRA
jgi:hypothetical protein